ncbi:hypothetical protein F5Y07DRAFT_335873 [Xylaria sp. FL0933]|nr:hypothetical protein F5Y07DRAFT_335873 [Xylaria sp. FL0933]
MAIPVEPSNLPGTPTHTYGSGSEVLYSCDPLCVLPTDLLPVTSSYTTSITTKAAAAAGIRTPCRTIPYRPGPGPIPRSPSSHTRLPLLSTAGHLVSFLVGLDYIVHIVQHIHVFGALQSRTSSTIIPLMYIDLFSADIHPSIIETAPPFPSHALLHPPLFLLRLLTIAVILRNCSRSHRGITQHSIHPRFLEYTACNSYDWPTTVQITYVVLLHHLGSCSFESPPGTEFNQFFGSITISLIYLDI